MPFKTLLCSMCLAVAFFAAAPAASAGGDAADAVLVAQLEGEDVCPSILYSTEVVEGAYDGVECGDFCYLSLKLPNGSYASYGASGDVQDFEARIGAKVRVTVEKRQQMTGIEDLGYQCEDIELATEIALIR